MAVQGGSQWKHREGLIRNQSVNLLVGDSGLGKTPLGIQLGVCVAAGLSFLGLQVHCAYRKPHTHGSRGRPALAQGRRAQPA